MSLIVLIGMAVFFLAGAAVILFTLSDNSQERQLMFERIASKQQGKVVRGKVPKLVVAHRNGELVLSFEKRWVKGRRRGHRTTSLHQVSVAAFQLNGLADRSFHIVIKEPALEQAYSMLGDMIQGMSERTGISMTADAAQDEFMIISAHPVLAREFLSPEVKACLLEIRDSRPSVQLAKGRFELLLSRKLETEAAWEDLLARGRVLVDRLCEVGK